MSEPISSALAKRLANAFRYREEDAAKILPLCLPQDSWIDQYPEGVIEEMGSAELLIISVLESRADRFLNFEDSRPATKVEQREYLQALDHHLTAAYHLLVGTRSIQATIADPFKFFERVSKGRGDPASANELRARIFKEMLPLQMFARWRLANDLRPSEHEQEEEEIKRRRTFPRFCYVADLLAAYQRITGKEPGISAHGGKISEALDFIVNASRPVLLFAGKAPMDAETAKKECQAVKALWRKGIRPEYSYASPDWGKHKWAYDVGI